MLPVEILTESVAFLTYYDLGALKITSRLCSCVASRCAAAIRIFDFSEFTFVVSHTGFHWFWDLESGWNMMTNLERFADDESAVAFISEAFRNCIFGTLEVNGCSRRVLEAIKNVASAVVVAELSFDQVPKGEHELPPSAMPEILDVVDAFRQVQKLEIIFNVYPVQLIGVEHREVAALCQRKGIQLSEERTRPTNGFI